MLLQCAIALPKTPVAVVEYHTQQVRRYLIERLRSPNELCDTDFFATWFLAYGIPFRSRTSEWFHHVKGAMTIANHLSATQPMSSLRVVLGPWLHTFTNEIYIYRRLFGEIVPCLGIPYPSPTFAQRGSVCKRLIDVGSQVDWVSQGVEGSKLFTVLTVLSPAVYMLFICLYRTASIEASVRGHGDIYFSVIDELVDYISNDLADITFRQELAAITAKFREATEARWPTSQMSLMLLILVQLARCLELGMQISRCHSVTSLFASSKSAFIADQIITSYRTHVTLLPDLRNWQFRNYLRSLVLAGLSLHTVEDVAKRNVFVPQLLILQDGRWLEDELNCLGLGETADCLKECWATGLSSRSIECTMKGAVEMMY
jgi:hypothetical protein